MRNFLRYWRDPGYWRWRWGQVGEGARFGLVLLLAGLIGLGGYYTAVVAGSGDTTAAYMPPTQKLVTVQQTVIHRVNGAAKVVTEVRRVAVPSPSERAVTVTGERTITLPGTGRTVIKGITVESPGHTQTVVQSQTVERPVTITTALTGATRTVNVTGPGRTVTATGPTQTITNTVTQPPRTVTEATTQTVTTRETVATTVTVSLTVTVPCKKPC